MHINRKQWQTVAGLFSIIVVYVLIALQSIQAPFFPIDDIKQLAHVRAMDEWHAWLGRDVFGFYRPIKNLYFVTFDALPSVAAARLIAILTGILAILAVFGALHRLTTSTKTALFATAVWAWAPTLVSSTAWLSAINIMCMTALAGAAIVCHDQATRHNQPNRLLPGTLAIVCAALALLAYEGAISLIPILLAIDFFLHPGRLTTRRNIPLYGTYILLGSTYMFIRVTTSGTADITGFFSDTSTAQAALAAGWFTVEHLLVWIWPFRRFAIMGGYYHGMLPLPLLLATWICVLALAAGALAMRKQNPLAGLGIAWFLLGFAPMSNIVGFRNGPWGDYYMTFASIGLALVLGVVVAYLFSAARQYPEKAMRILMLASVLILIRIAAIAESVSWSRAWNLPAETYERTINTFPHAWGAWIELAKLELNNNKSELARKFAEQAATLAPDQFEHLPVLAIASLQQGDHTAAETYTRSYRHAFPENAWALGMLGYIAETANEDREAAAALYEQVLAKEPWSIDAIFAAKRLALQHLDANRIDKAISIWIRIIQIVPDDRETNQNLALAYTEKGMHEMAARHLQAAKPAQHAD